MATAKTHTRNGVTSYLNFKHDGIISKLNERMDLYATAIGSDDMSCPLVELFADIEWELTMEEVNKFRANQNW